MRYVKKCITASLILVFHLTCLSEGIEINIFPCHCDYKVFVVGDSEKYPAYNDKLEVIAKNLFSVHFYIVIRNISDKNLAFMKSDNSWGYRNLSFVIYNGEKTSFKLTKKKGIWHRDIPEFFQLLPNETYVIPVSLSSKIWTNTTKLKQILNGRIKATYKEADEKLPMMPRNIWIGSVQSKLFRLVDVLPSHLLSDKKNGAEMKNKHRDIEMIINKKVRVKIE